MPMKEWIEYLVTTDAKGGERYTDDHPDVLAGKAQSGSRIPTKPAWKCPHCHCRQYPFSRGKSMVLTMKDPDGPDRIVVTHPPPAPIMSVASALRYDTYKALIETHGDDARNALPGVKLQGPKTKNPHSGEMCHRIESRDKVKEWEDNDWWEVAALASGMQPNEIKEYLPLGQNGAAYATSPA